jgi:hypothetical protein
MRLPVSETLAWPDALLAGGSEMGRRIHAFDWSRTPLGPIDRWTRSLRAYVGMIVDNPFPMYVFWGEHDVVIYNDASIAFTGNKHPEFFGRTSADFWDGHRSAAAHGQGGRTGHARRPQARAGAPRFSRRRLFHVFVFAAAR